MEAKKSSKNLKTLIFIIGVLFIVFGLYANGPRLIEFVSTYISSDGKLTDETTEFLNRFQTVLIVSGILLLVLSFLLKYLYMLWEFVARKIQSGLIENAINSIGKFFSRIYYLGTKEKFLLGLAIVILLSFLIPSIFLSPYGGFHVEGINLQPPKNLVEHGIYGTLSTEGFDKYTYRISAGPGILLPDALVFKLFGVNVYYVRTLYIIFVLLAIFMLYYSARRMFDKNAALLALFLLIPLLPLTGNQAADAYIPGLFYFLVGAYFWFKSIEAKKNFYLVLSGILWGISFQTQWLFLFAIFTVIATCIILYFAKNGLKSKYFTVPSLGVIAVSLAWTLFRILNVGLKQEVKHLQQFWAAHGHRAVGITTESGSVPSIFSVLRPNESLFQIDFWRDFQFFLVIPSVIYLFILVRKKKWTDYKSLFFLNFTIIWFLWWIFFNYDLPDTHFFIITLMSQIFTAKILYDIWKYSFNYKGNFVSLSNNKENNNGATVFYLIRIIIVCIVIGKTVFPLFTEAGDMYNNNIKLIKPYNEMMAYIDNNTEKDAIFSGWGWSIPWYVDLNGKIDRVCKDRRAFPFDQREKVPEYFIVSPEWPLVKVTEEWPSVVVENSWSKKQNNLRKKFLAENCSLLKTYGGDKHKWLLYKVNNENTNYKVR